MAATRRPQSGCEFSAELLGFLHDWRFLAAGGRPLWHPVRRRARRDQRDHGAPGAPGAFASANLRTGTAVSFVNTATTSSTAVLATLSMQEEFGISAVGAGFALLPLSLGVIVGSALTKPIGTRLPPRRLAAVGLAAIAAGNLVLVLTYGGMAGLVAGVCLAGLGLGMASVAGTSIGTDVEDSLSGTASGVLNTGAQLGTAIGVAAFLLLASVVSEPGTGTVVAWAAIAGLVCLTTLALLARSGTTERAATH